jgi:class 3 adenylate cyclase
MSRLTRNELSERLDERNDHPDQCEAIDRALWQECGADRAVLVLDMSGFTRITRRRGILHFLSVYRRAHRLTVPLLEAHGGRLLKAEADNVIGVFPDAACALASAVAMMRGAAEANASLGVDDQMLLCIAVGYGHILELQDDFFGDEVNITFKLGEDVAKAGEVLLTEGGLQDARARGETPVVQERETIVGGVPVRHFAVSYEP